MPSDLDEVWLVVAAATPEVNREVVSAAENRRVFVNAVDDPANASAFLSGVVAARRRDDRNLHQRRGACAHRAGARSRGRALAERPGRVDAIARTARLERKRDAVPMDSANPACCGRSTRVRRSARACLEASSPFDRLRVSESRASRSKTVDARLRAERVPWLNAPGGLLAVTGHVSLVGAGPGDPAC